MHGDLEIPTYLMYYLTRCQIWADVNQLLRLHTNTLQLHATLVLSQGCPQKFCESDSNRTTLHGCRAARVPSAIKGRSDRPTHAVEISDRKHVSCHLK